MRGFYCYWLLVVLCSVSAQESTLYGSGTTNAQPLLDLLFSRFMFKNDGVRFHYTGDDFATTLELYRAGRLNFLVSDVVLPPVVQEAIGLQHFPLAAQAMVFSYNLPSLDSQAPRLVLDEDSIGLIWIGNITFWNDPAIKRLNPLLAEELPAEPILLAYSADATAAISVDVLLTALLEFSSAFRNEFQRLNSTFELLLPVKRGTAVPIPPSFSERVAWIKAHSNSMAILPLGVARAANLTWTDMINKAGNRVEPNTKSVESALKSYPTPSGEGEFNTSIYNGDGVDLWPFTTFIHFYFNSGKQLSLTTTQIDFLIWFYTNNAACISCEGWGFVPVPVFWRKKIIQSAQRFIFGAPQLQLFGVGSPIPIFILWASSEISASYSISYQPSCSYEESLQNLAWGNVDFVTTLLGQKSKDDSIALMPAVALPIVLGYNLPELGNEMRLVLDFNVLAGIYLQNITMWDDQRIKDINAPVVASFLPSQKIRVIVEDQDQQGFQKILSAALRASVPEFAAVPNNSSFGIGNSSTQASSGDVLNQLSYFPYTLTLATLYEVLMIPWLNHASLVNPAGNVVQPSATTVRNAINDYVSSGSTSLSYEKFILAPGYDSWPLVAVGSFLYRQSTMKDCSRAENLANFFYYAQADPTSKKLTSNMGLVLASSVNFFNDLFISLLLNFTCQGEPVNEIFEPKACNSNCSSTRIWVPIISILLPVLGLAGLLLICALVTVARKNRSKNDYEIDFKELIIGNRIGFGSYGNVHKAEWKGTEVAVKVMGNSKKIAKEATKHFNQEVRVLKSIRHPNLVLFMASTSIPKLCIVMEYMELGSLYDLLQNELTENMTFFAKAKMAYQGSKGMHFLHSCGIVHRDLKSLNLLVDTKWNIKVSDFGLSNFKEAMKIKSEQLWGSVQWIAPEVILKLDQLDLEKADVYSFGIILWELLTRQQPYLGMSTAAVAIGVVRDGLRPHVPPNARDLCPDDYKLLINACLNEDPSSRPSFFRIMANIISMLDAAKEQPSGGSFEYPTSLQPLHLKEGTDISSTMQRAIPGTPSALSWIKPSRSELAIACAGIVDICGLWESDPVRTKDIILNFGRLLLGNARRGSAYEIRGEHHGKLIVKGCICVAFPCVKEAIDWCVGVQQDLQQSEETIQLLGGRGVTIGLHVGYVEVSTDPFTRRLECTGPAVDYAYKISKVAAAQAPGRISITYTAFRLLSKQKELKAQSITRLNDQLLVYTDGDDQIETTHRAYNPSRMCRWMLRPLDISLNHPLSDTLHIGRWKGIDVVIEQLWPQHPASLSDKYLLTFWSEVGVLSGLRHPNVLLCIGGCWSQSNFCVVSERVTLGSLRDLLSHPGVELSWACKLHLLHGAACGLQYLHSLDPPTFHGNFTSYYLMVDEDWNAKVNGFGFSRWKQECDTRTGHSRSPRWTAPELLQGNKSTSKKQEANEKADVYSLGVVMWEILTGRLPFEGGSFVEVALQIANGSRPPLEAITHEEGTVETLKDLMKKCWQSEPNQRPTMKEVVEELNDLLTTVVSHNILPMV